MPNLTHLKVGDKALLCMCSGRGSDKPREVEVTFVGTVHLRVNYGRAQFYRATGGNSSRSGMSWPYLTTHEEVQRQEEMRRALAVLGWAGLEVRSHYGRAQLTHAQLLALAAAAWRIMAGEQA